MLNLQSWFDTLARMPSEYTQRDKFCRVIFTSNKHRRRAYYVMEIQIGRAIDYRRERVWHINFKRWDDAPENLVLLNKAAHMKLLRSVYRATRYIFGMTNAEAYRQNLISFDSRTQQYVAVADDYCVPVHGHTLTATRNDCNISQMNSKEIRLIILRHYSDGDPVCACCGETHIEFLTIDHIGGGGNQHRRILGGTSLYFWILRNGFPDGFRILCWNCNLSFAKHGRCPHGQIAHGEPTDWAKFPTVEGMLQSDGFMNVKGRRRAYVVLEKKLGRPVDWRIHRVLHINQIKDDDAPENLDLLTKTEYMRVCRSLQKVRRSASGESLVSLFANGLMHYDDVTKKYTYAPSGTATH